MSQALFAASNLHVWYICTLVGLWKYLKIYYTERCLQRTGNTLYVEFTCDVSMLGAELSMLYFVTMFRLWPFLYAECKLFPWQYWSSHSFRVKDFWPVCQPSSSMTRLLGHVLGTQASVQENISLGYYCYHSQSHRKLEGLHIYCIQLLRPAKLIKLWNPTLSSQNLWRF